jgi:hypothetical protein
MSKANAAFDVNDTEIFADEIADEALEAAACSGRQNAMVYTLVMCTGQAECPY